MIIRYLLSILFLINIINANHYVSKIIYSGNSSFTVLQLTEIISLQSPSFFSRSEFKPKLLNRDVVALISFYKAHGFLEVNIVGDYTNKSDQNVEVIFSISEGIQYYLKNIAISGNKLFTDEWVKQLMSVEPGNIYNPAFLRNRLKELKRSYLKKGKLYISIMDESDVVGNEVSLRVNISEGTTFKINTIFIEGLESVKKKYVLREITFNKDDVYNIVHIENTRKRVFESGLFSSVDLIPKVKEENSGIVDILIKVREYNSSSIEAQFGFNQLPSAKGDFPIPAFNTQGQWSLGNIFNSSANLSLSGEFGFSYFEESSFYRRYFELLYRSPWILKFRVPISIKYFHEALSDKHNLIVNGVKYSQEYRWGRNTKLLINSTLEFISTDSTNTNIKTEQERSLNIIYEINRIQNYLNPVGGYYFNISPAIYGTLLGGERHYFKFETQYKTYFKVGTSSVLAGRIQYGIISILDYYFPGIETAELPSYDKFHLGGQTSLRGWRSPDAFEETSESPGGLIREIINLEFRFPVYKNIGGELFIDSGRLYTEWSEFLTIPHRWNYGWGVTYLTALGPIRIDVGYPVEDSPIQYHASLLYMF